ncbi:MAG: S1C family serine protease, partial [Coriobacteriales bacterium]|nr:S1C family serine protease [Coriobacteriales bacterium]
MSDSEQQPTSWTTPQGAEAASEPATQDSAQDTPQPTSPINFHTDEAASLAEIKGGLGSDHQVRVAGQGFAQDLSREGQGHFAAAQLETGSQAKVQAMAVGTNGSALDVANPSVQANSEQKPGQASALDPLTGTVGADALAFGQTASGHQGNEANLTGAARSEKTSADSALSGQSSELSQPSVSQATAGQSTLVAAQTLRTPTGPSYSTSASGGQAYLGSQVGGDQASAGGSGAIPPYGQAGPALHPTVMAKPKSHKVLGQTAKNFWMCLVVAVVCCILTVCVLFFTGHLGSTSYVSGGSSGSNITINPSDADSTTLPEAVAAKVTPSVVNIDVYQAQSSQPSSIWDLFGNGSGSGSSSSNSSTLTKTSLGSGIVISADGYILTCAHVVSGADKLMVTFDENQPQLEAKVVGVDTEDDIAVIKVNASG